MEVTAVRPGGVSSAGYTVYNSSSMAAFPDNCRDIFLADNPLSEPVYIVAQNAGLGEWLSRYLARKEGGVMGMNVLMPEQALRFFVEQFPGLHRKLNEAEAQGTGGPQGAEGTQSVQGTGGPQGAEGTQSTQSAQGIPAKKFLYMDGMKLVVYKALEEVLAASEAVYAPLREYVSKSEGPRLIQLSDAVAGIFNHYGMNVLSLVKKWDEGGSFSFPYPEHRQAQNWQKSLWRRIFRPEAPYIHLSRVLDDIMELGLPYEGPAIRVVLMGSMFLGETGLHFFRYLARFVDVHHFVLTPGAVRPAGDAPLPPFLEDNNRLAAGFWKMLPDCRIRTLEAGSTSGSAGRETAEQPDTLLHRLQDSLRKGRSFQGTVSDDGSFLLHDVCGIRREVEVLKDRILAALRDDDSLAPSEIGVLAPDIGVYAPHIQMIFPSREGLYANDAVPFNLTDLPARSDSPYLRAFASLCELPGSRFGRHSMMKLFSNPCFADFEADTAEEWLYFIDSLNVRWGVNKKHRSEEGALDTQTGSWHTAFERILEAYYHADCDGNGMLPADLSGENNVKQAGELIMAVRKLDKRLRKLDKSRKSLKEWVLVWEKILDDFLKTRPGDEGAEDRNDRLQIKKVFRNLNALSSDVSDLQDFSEDTLPWPAFSRLLEENLGKISGRHGRYLSQGVSCASLKPLRAVPFRRIYVLGFQEGAWPGREYLSGFDLREQIPRSIDLSRESVDRFAFLETIFSASEHLAFFYHGRESERGDPVSPASPLMELLEYMGKGWEDSLRVVHPLVSYDEKALTGEGLLSTSSEETLKLAVLRREGLKAAGRRNEKLVQEQPPAFEEETVDWTRLLQFVKNPVQFFFRDVMRAGGEFQLQDESEDDVLEAPFLEWWNWRNTLLEERSELILRPQDMVEEYVDYLNRLGIAAHTPAREFQKGQWLEDAQAIALQAERIEREEFQLDMCFSVIFDPALKAGQLGERPASGQLNGAEIRIGAPCLENLKITGRVNGLGLLQNSAAPAAAPAEIWTLLSFISGNNIGSYHNVKGWLTALLLGAALQQGSLSGVRELREFRVGARDFPARRYYWHSKDFPENSGGEPRVMEKPLGILASLLKAFQAGTRAALPLYPELADRLGKRYGSTSEQSRGELETAAVTEWNSILGAFNNNYSRLGNCSWRRRFLENPDFASAEFFDMWKELYFQGGLL